MKLEILSLIISNFTLKTALKIKLIEFCNLNVFCRYEKNHTPIAVEQLHTGSGTNAIYNEASVECAERNSDIRQME
jgi:hypothetical protein